MSDVPLEAYGVSRVLAPASALAQAAERLDASAPLGEHEIEVEVDTLCLDSTSFRQLVESSDGDPERVAAAIATIVAQRGKMHNPVTDSGGILTGTVRAVGPAYRDPPALGARIVSLASLTLTPLRLDEVGAVDLADAHVPVRGTAYLTWLIPWALVPAALPLDVALAGLDVGNAPVQTRDLIGASTRTVLVLGGGSAGLLAMAAARESLGPEGRIVLMDVSASVCERALGLGLCDVALRADLRDTLGTLDRARRHGVTRADVTVVVVNAPGCETTALALTADEGTVLFFSMATGFSRAALGSESVASRARMIIGSGYAADRGAYVLDLLERSRELRDALAPAHPQGEGAGSVRAPVAE